MKTKPHDEFAQAGQAGLDVLNRKYQADIQEEKREKAQRRAVDAWADQTVCALHEIDKLEAKPLRKAIRRAERANGHHLMIELQPNLALTARGLRFVNSVSSTCGAVFDPPATALTRIHRQSVEDRIPYQNTAPFVAHVRACLKREGLHKELVYAGADEWPISWLTESLYRVGAFFGSGALVGLPFVLMAHMVTDRKNSRSRLPLHTA